MDHLDHFRGTYSGKHEELERQRDELIEQIRGFVPDNYLELIEASEDGEPQHELKWVKVPDPRSDDPTPVLEVLPVIGLWRGQEEKEPVAPGLAGLMLVGKLPNGEESVIGDINALGGPYEPLLTLNQSDKDPSRRKMAEWESADAELFIALVKSALDAQHKTPQDIESNAAVDPSITMAQIERGSVALQVFAETWGLSLNPENLDLMTYAVLSNAGSPGKIDDVTPEEIEQITGDAKTLLAEDAASHHRMLEAQQRSIDER